MPTSAPVGSRYRWIALSNTTIGVLMVTINQMILLIALPDIFRGIGLNPLEPGNTGYLLWLMMGFMLVTAVLVVSFGRLGDMYGRVRMYNLGFAVFTVCSIFLSVVWMHGSAAAIWLIGWRVAQGIGGALLFANSTAIITDAFPEKQRGTALGINAIAGIAGSFIGLVLGGVLGPLNWRLVFLVSVPVGLFGTVWAYLMLRDHGVRKRARMDWWGNLTFGIGLIAVLVGITYGIQPYHGRTMGWTNPWVLGAMFGGVGVLCLFLFIETRIAEPLFRLSLFRNRAFAMGNLANLLMALGRGGLQFMLIIWLQGIWLPQHGFSFERTPLWAGIYMIPLTVGFFISAPLCGMLSDRLGVRFFTVGGALVTGGSFVALLAIPVNFSYPVFAVLLVVNGIGSGMFSSPNRAEIMNAVPEDQRGAGAGMNATFMNASMVLSIGIFFSLMVTGLAHSLPPALQTGLTAQGVSPQAAGTVSHLPPIAVLFAAFLGYNPMRQLLGPELHRLPADRASFLSGRSFFPHLITQPFHHGLFIAFFFAIAACVIAAAASLVTKRRRHRRRRRSRARAVPAGRLVSSVNGVATPTANGWTTSLSGLVHDGTGTPVPEAMITITGPDGRQLGRTRSGPDGRYRIETERGEHIVIVAASGRAPRAAAVPAKAQAACDFALAANTAGEIRGVVRSSQGEPLGGITLTVTDVRGEVVATAVSERDGRYRFGGFADGTYTLVAAGHRARTVVVDVDVTVRQGVHAREGVTVRAGTDVRGEGPVGGATVTLADAAGAAVATTVTEADGVFVFDDVPPGRYAVITAGYGPAAVPVRIEDGRAAEADVTLTRE